MEEKFAITKKAGILGIIGNIFFTYQYQSYIQNYNNKIATLVNLIEKEYPNIDRNELVSILNSNKKVSENIF